MPDISINTASLRDLGDLRRLEHACFEEDAWPLLDLVGVLTMPGIIRLKASIDGKMAGFIAGDLRGPDSAGWITTLGVMPAYRRQGIAAALLQACEARMILPLIRLCVRRSNQTAIRVYEKRDYHQVGVWTKYYNGKEDALVLEKKLDAI
jgi:ribosomal protein S18 acetylase RimI-like enzyme